MDSLESRTLLATQVVGYLPDYEYSPSLVSHLDWRTLTTLNYFSVVPSARGSMPLHSDANFNLSNLRATVSAARSHGVRVNIVIGGAGLDSTLAEIAADPRARKTFANSVVQFCNSNHLSGIDLDWEPLHPTAAQIENYGALIHTLRATSGLSISAAVNPEKLSLATNADPQGQSAEAPQAYLLNAQAVLNLNSIGVMAYDLDFANHADYARSTQDMAAWSTYVVSIGASKRALLFGVPFYGRAGSSWNDSVAESYSDIVDNFIEQSDESPAAATDSLRARFGSDVFSNQSVAWYFNGKTTVANKAKYAIQKNLGGVMIWNLGQDHFDSSGDYDTYSLLPAVKEAIAKYAPSNAKPAANSLELLFSTLSIERPIDHPDVLDSLA